MEHADGLESNGTETTVVMPLGSRLANVIAGPGELFDYLRTAKPSVANWLVPALIYMVVGWVCATALLAQDWYMPQIIRPQLEALQQQVDAGKMTEEQIEPIRNQVEKYGAIGETVKSYAAPLVFGLVGPFLYGCVLWLVGAKALRGKLSYMKAVEIAGLAAIIATLGRVLKTLLILMQGDVMASASPAFFIGERNPGNPLHAMVAWLDVMVIWSLVILAMGVAKVVGRPVGGAMLWVGGLYALWVVSLVGLLVLAQRLGGG